jgi:hypothetical protein
VKPSPFDIRLELLRRFPAWTQPGWTYLTSLAPPGAPRRLRWTAARHIGVWLLVYALAVSLGISCAGIFIEAALGGLAV